MSRSCPVLRPVRVEGSGEQEFLRRLYFVAKFPVTGPPAGEPTATKSALESLTLPLVWASPPFEERLASRSAIPPSPAEESRKPVEARSKPVTFSLASRGVSAVSASSTGPAVPSSLNLPPLGRSALTNTGNLVVNEPSETVTRTLSSGRRL